jgi:hypothetical protein
MIHSCAICASHQRDENERTRNHGTARHMIAWRCAYAQCHLIMPQFAPVHSHDDDSYQKPTSGGASSEGGRSDRSIQIIAELHPLLKGCSRQSVPCGSMPPILGAIGTPRVHVVAERGRGTAGGRTEAGLTATQRMQGSLHGPDPTERTH